MGSDCVSSDCASQRVPGGATGMYTSAHSRNLPLATSCLSVVCARVKLRLAKEIC